MADPLSITASIIAVVQMSEAVILYLREVKDIRKECKKLLLDLNYTQGLLKIIQETVQDVKEAGNWGATMKVLGSQGSPLESLKGILESLQNKFGKDASAKGLARLTKSLFWPLNKKETEDILQAVERQKSLLLIAFDNDHILLSAEIKKDTAAILRDLQQVQQDLQRVVVTVSSADRNLQDDAVAKALNWLSPLHYETTQIDTYKQHFAGSLSWFLEGPEFRSWLSEDGKTLFCPGIPGAGKTILASAVIHHLNERFPPEEDEIGIAWAYFSSRARASQTRQNVLGSICAQLALRRKDLADKVVAARMVALKSFPNSTPDHVKLLRECFLKYKKVYLVMDAMDEYSEDDMAWLDSFDQLRKLTPHINILVTSRPIASIEKEFSNALRVEILAQEGDIISYIRAGLEKPALRKHTSTDLELKTYIERTLVEKSQGMFLLTKLHMDTVQKKARYSKMAMREAVESLPKQLDETYRETLQRINSQDDDDALLAKQVLAWVHLTYTSLSVRILQQAVAKTRGDDPGRDDCLIESELLVSVCAGLVVVDEGSQLIRLVHYTVEEYFERCFNEFYPNALRDVNYCCLRQVIDSGQLSAWMLWREHVGGDRFWYEEMQDIRESIQRDRQLHYAQVPFSGYAMFHVETQLRDEAVELRHNQNPPIFHRGLTMQNTIQNRPSEDLEVAYKVLPKGESIGFGLLCAVFYGDTSDLFRIVNAPGFTASADTLSRCLAFAAFQGADEIVNCLLQANASVEQMYEYAVCPIDYLFYPKKRNCLGFAIHGGHSSTAKELLDLHPELADSPVYASFDGQHTWKHETALEDLRSKMIYNNKMRGSEEWQAIKLELQKRRKARAE